MKSKASIKNIKLPDAPKPTKANFHDHHVDGYGKYITVLPSGYKPRPPVTLKLKSRKTGKAKKPAPRKLSWNDENIKILIDMYNEGALASEIAEKLGCSPKKVYSMATALRQRGELHLQRRPTIWTDEQEKKMIEMYEAGAVYTDIAQAVGRSPSVISGRVNKLVKAGKLTSRKRGRK